MVVLGHLDARDHPAGHRDGVASHRIAHHRHSILHHAVGICIRLAGARIAATATNVLRLAQGWQQHAPCSAGSRACTQGNGGWSEVSPRERACSVRWGLRMTGLRALLLSVLGELP